MELTTTDYMYAGLILYILVLAGMFGRIAYVHAYNVKRCRRYLELYGLTDILAEHCDHVSLGTLGIMDDLTDIAIDHAYQPGSRFHARHTRYTVRQPIDKDYLVDSVVVRAGCIGDKQAARAPAREALTAIL